MKKSKMYAMFGVIGSLALILLILSINVRPYLTVSQVTKDPSLYDNQEIEVKGIVDSYDDDGGNFRLEEDSDDILVKTNDIDIPNDVEDGMEVVVTGIYDASSNTLTATEILTQCS